MANRPTTALDQFRRPTSSIVSFPGSSSKEGRGKQLVPVDPPPRMERVNTETIRNRLLHDHDLTLENSDRPYVCFGCKEDGNGERFRCSRSGCRNDGPQYHKFCAQPENNRNHHYFPGCCFSLVIPNGSRRCVDLYCAACSKDIEGFYYNCSHPRHKRNLHPWCMYLESNLQVNNMTVLLVSKISMECIECGLRALTRNGTDLFGTVVPKKKETWGYLTEDGLDIIHIHCMKARLREFWRSRNMTEEDLIARKVFAKDNRRGFLKGVVQKVSKVMFGIKEFFANIINDPVIRTAPRALTWHGPELRHKPTEGVVLPNNLLEGVLRYKPTQGVVLPDNLLEGVLRHKPTQGVVLPNNLLEGVLRHKPTQGVVLRNNPTEGGVIRYDRRGAS